MWARRIWMFLSLIEERTVWAVHLVFMRDHISLEMWRPTLLYSDPQSTYSIARLLNSTTSSSSSPAFSALQCEVSDAVPHTLSLTTHSCPLLRFVRELSKVLPAWSPTESWCTVRPSPAGCVARLCTPCQASRDTSTKLTPTW